jgi:proton glutamate symport protein
MVKNKLNFLLSPWLVILGMISGVTIGIYFEDIVPYIDPFGKIYLSLLKMCVIPILAAAVITSVGKLFSTEEAAKNIRRIITIFVIFLIGVSLVFSAVGFLAKTFINIDLKTQQAIGRIALSAQEDVSSDSSNYVVKKINSQHPPLKNDELFLIPFIINIIPENIFTSLAKGETLKVIFFLIVLGIMLKNVSNKSRNNIIILFEGIFEAFQELIRIIIYFLPFGLVAMMASQFSQADFIEPPSLLKFIILFYISGFIIFLISTFIIWWQGGKPYFQQFNLLKEVLVISLGARNSYAAIPSGIEGLSSRFNFDQQMVNLSVPLGITIFRFGNIMYFFVAAIFAAMLYGNNLGLSQYFIISITSILAAIASSGAPGPVVATMVGLVLNPLGIPTTAIIAMLIAIDPIIDSICTLVTVYPNLAAAAVIATNKSGLKEKVQKAKDSGQVKNY